MLYSRLILLIMGWIVAQPTLSMANSHVFNHVDAVEIIKHKRELKLILKDKVLKTYRIALGKKPKGRKQEAEDGRTPEGTYFISRKLMDTEHHLSLQISYPNPQDKEQANRSGKDTGDMIAIHGLPKYGRYIPNLVMQFQYWVDWTSGGIGLTDKDIDEIFDLVDVGTPVIIFA